VCFEILWWGWDGSLKPETIETGASLPDTADTLTRSARSYPQFMVILTALFDSILYFARQNCSFPAPNLRTSEAPKLRTSTKPPCTEGHNAFCEVHQGSIGSTGYETSNFCQFHHPSPPQDLVSFSIGRHIPETIRNQICRKMSRIFEICTITYRNMCFSIFLCYYLLLMYNAFREHVPRTPSHSITSQKMPSARTKK
jgi:hypothetical protein